jgi:hypothetical protein
MSLSEYSLYRSKLLGNDLYQLLSLGFPIDSDTLQQRLDQLEAIGILVDEQTFVDVLGLGNTPNQTSTATLIQQRVQRMKQILGNKIDSIKDLEPLELE